MNINYDGNLKHMKPKLLTNPVFITTIPKAGKNVMQSFLSNLGFVRFDLEHQHLKKFTIQSTYFTYLRSLLDIDRRATFVCPVLTSNEINESKINFNRFIESLYTFPPKSYVVHHFAFNENLYKKLSKNGIPIVFLYRDPRDILTSMAIYIRVRNKPEHLVNKFNHLSLEESILLLLEGDKEFISFFDYLKIFNGWLKAKGVLCLRFEDIIGPLGLGNKERQFLSFSQLANHIGWKDQKEVLESAVFNTFSTLTRTYVKGVIGGWREVFTERVHKLFNEKFEDSFSLWQYEEEYFCDDQYVAKTRYLDIHNYFLNLLRHREQSFIRKQNSLIERIKKLEIIKQKYQEELGK